MRSVDRTVVYKNGRKHRYKGSVLRLSQNKRGYQKTIFSVGNVHTTPRVCRLVAEAFIPNPCGYTQVNHKDEDKLNDKAENLEWCTARYNMNYGHRAEKCSEKISKAVVQLTISGELVREWKSAREAETVTGIDHSHIARCCRGKLGQTGGYKWQYKI